MGAPIRDELRRHLKERMVARDKAAVEALRVAIAKIENAEAQPIGDDGPGHGTRQALGLAAGDVPRRLVTDADARALVADEIAELEASAEEYRSVGQTDAAATLDRQAEVLRNVLDRSA